MRKLLLLALVLAMAGCASSTDRHDLYYQSMKEIAKERAQERQAELQLKMEFLKAVVTGYQVPDTPTNQLVKVMAMMMLFNDREDPYALSRALREVKSPAPTIGERIADGTFRILPVALGIAGAAYGGYLIEKAGEYGAATAVANAPTTVNNSTTNEHYNVNSYNSQEANMGQSNSSTSGGSGGGGRDTSNSHNQGNVGVIGQSQDFSADNAAMRSTGYQAPYNIPVVIP